MENIIRELETVSGQLVDIENPDPMTINIEDIAWGLSRMSRFCGQTVTAIPYNIALHSIFVAEEVATIVNSEYVLLPLADKQRLILGALLHDSPEAFTGDLPSPVKHLAALRPIIVEIENRLMVSIYTSLQLPPLSSDDHKIIKRADLIAQKIEAYQFMPSRGKHWVGLPTVSLERLQQFSDPLDSLTSYKLFMSKFKELYTPGELI